MPTCSNVGLHVQADGEPVALSGHCVRAEIVTNVLVTLVTAIVTQSVLYESDVRVAAPYVGKASVGTKVTTVYVGAPQTDVC